MGKQIIRIGDVVQVVADGTDYDGCIGIVKKRLISNGKTRLAIAIPLPPNRMATIFVSETNHEVKRIGTAIVLVKRRDK